PRSVRSRAGRGFASCAKEKPSPSPSRPIVTSERRCGATGDRTVRYNRRWISDWHVFSGINKDKPMSRATQRLKHARKAQRTARKPGSVTRRSKAPPPRSARAKTISGKRKSHPRRHTFVASHDRPDAFEQGLRRYAQYRDL